MEEDKVTIRVKANIEMLEEVINDLEKIVSGKSNLDYQSLIDLYKEFIEDYNKYFKL